ncbi:MAG: DUF1549 and DUF1553 domain-containing protein [Bythopirellula sp.]|nr:DUF1549 and DUF1553 domain-containing protein [Bythopirellula sp.]
MNAGHEQFDDEASERQVEQLLTSALVAPPMSNDFVDRLSAELDREFELLAYANAKPQAAGVTHRAGWRVLATAAAAAALLLAVGLWGNRPAYGWAAMIEALEKCEWVQAITRSATNNTERAAIGWFSQSAQVVAREEGDARVYLNFQAGTAENFDPAERVIYQHELAAPRQMSGEFLALLLGMKDMPTELAKVAATDWGVVDESWRKVTVDSRDLIELQVTLHLQADDKLLRLEFLLDAETHLPVSGRVVDQQVASNHIDFSYPQQGPESIFALGVPREARVISAKPINAALAAVEQSEPAAAIKKLVVEELVVAGGAQSAATQPAATQPTGELKNVAAAAVPAKKPVQFQSVAALPEPLAEDELVEQVNTLLANFWQAQGIAPAEPASDSEFLRRVYLDLIGRIPMVSEVYAFLDDPGEDRRERLVDDLLSRRDHATHLAAVWRSVLLPEGVDLNTYGGTNKFDAWLADRFGQNMPYDEIVRQLLLAEGRVSESGPLLFYAALKLNPEEIAAKTSRVFLGTRMECAQCHDHPFDDRIAQTDFWGFAAHFAQISRPQGKMEMTSLVLRVHDNDFGEVMLPDTETVVPPQLPENHVPDAQGTADPTGMELSRRQQLAEWLTNQNNDHFARAGVNRVWQQVFGRGLIEPVDDMRPDNAPICPEVLDLLTRDFAASGFDLRKLLRALVLTEAYQLSSGSPKDDPSQALCFARMNMKSFTADQLFDCIAVATLNEAMTGQTPDGTLARTENMSRQAFIEQFRAAVGDRTDYQAGVPQALTLMHGSVVHGATDLASSGLLKSFDAPFFTDEQRLDTLFLATLSREPSAAEREKLLAYLQSTKDASERLGILGDVLWALLNSAEFTFIH